MTRDRNRESILARRSALCSDHYVRYQADARIADVGTASRQLRDFHLNREESTPVASSKSRV